MPNLTEWVTAIEAAFRAAAAEAEGAAEELRAEADSLNDTALSAADLHRRGELVETAVVAVAAAAAAAEEEDAVDLAAAQNAEAAVIDPNAAEIGPSAEGIAAGSAEETGAIVRIAMAVSFVPAATMDPMDVVPNDNLLHFFFFFCFYFCLLYRLLSSILHLLFCLNLTSSYYYHNSRPLRRELVALLI